MNNKSIVLIAVLFGLIVFGMFQYAILRNAEQTAPISEPDIINDIPTADDERPVLRQPPVTDDDIEPLPPTDAERPQVTAERKFANGVHTVSGTVTLPNPCYTIETEIVILESYPEQVQIRLNPTVTSEMCVQVISEVPFSADFIASEMASVAIMLDGNILLNL